MKRIAGLFGLMGIAAMAVAMSSYGKVFNDTYKVGKTSALAKASCAICHVSAKGGKLNPYGQDVSEAMKAAKSKKLTGDILKKVESEDSDKDGVKNIDEIKKDSNPGVK